MGKCKYCNTKIKKGRICPTCKRLKRNSPDFFGWVLSVDLETVTIDKWTGRRLTPSEIYETIKINEQPEEVASIISFGCAGLFNIVSGEKLYFDCEYKLKREYPNTFAIHKSSDLDNVLYATRNYLRNRYSVPRDKDIPFMLAWHNGNSYDLSFFHNTEFYNNINWSECCGENIHDLKILKIEPYDNINLNVVDTLKLFVKPLSKLGDEIGLEKLDGTSTYESAPVPPKQPTAEQLAYCFRDIDVVGQALIKYAKLDDWNEISDIPYTSTGRVRNAVHNLPNINMSANKVQTIFHMKYGNKIVDYSKSRQKAENHRIADFSRMDYKNFYANNSTEAINNVMLCFEGGICYYNFDQLAKVWENVESWDFSSHYPSCMLMGDFPIWAWKFYSVDIEEPDSEKQNYPLSDVAERVYKHFYDMENKAKSYDLITDCDGYFCCAEVFITGLKAKEWSGQMFPYLKENSKNAMSIVAEYYGGNIVSGTYSGYLTDLGFATLTMAYDYDTLRIDSVAICDKGNFKQLKGFKNNLSVISNIDPIFITAISEFAKDKTKYKHLEEQSEKEKGTLHPDTVNYRMLKMIAKTFLNGIYGNTAQNKLNYSKIECYDEPTVIRKEKWLQDNWNEYDGYKIGFKNLIEYCKTEEGTKEITSKKTELNQRWLSEYVTGYARYFLVYFATYIISRNLGTILYCDTDSIKVHWNSTIAKEKFLKKCDLFRLTFEENCKNNPLTLQVWDNIKDLGNFDYEHTYNEFVTFGNKRYLTRINDEIGCTFAGFSRKDIGEGMNVVQYDVTACNNSITEFVSGSGIKYHINCNAEDNRKLDKCRQNEGVQLDFGGITTAGVVLCPNMFSTTDIDICFEDERVHYLMLEEGSYTFGTMAKIKGTYPTGNTFRIDREGKRTTERITDAHVIVANA